MTADKCLPLGIWLKLDFARFFYHLSFYVKIGVRLQPVFSIDLVVDYRAKNLLTLMIRDLAIIAKSL